MIFALKNDSEGKESARGKEWAGRSNEAAVVETLLDEKLFRNALAMFRDLLLVSYYILHYLRLFYTLLSTCRRSCGFHSFSQSIGQCILEKWSVSNVRWCGRTYGWIVNWISSLSLPSPLPLIGNFINAVFRQLHAINLRESSTH